MFIWIYATELENFKTENDIDLNDFLMHVALNKAILDFVKNGGKNISSDEDKEKLKKYFFSNLLAIFENIRENKNVLGKMYSRIISDAKRSIYLYKNYFFKLQKDFSIFPFTANEYDVYNKIKENVTLKNNINKYYGCFDREINNKKDRFIVSKNLQKDNFSDLSIYRKKDSKKELTEQQADRIIKEVLIIVNTLEKEAGLYNYDLKPKNVMMNDEGEIKLIDYEGMVPKDSTNLVATYPLICDCQFITDETLRSSYYDYIKFCFILEMVSNIKSDINKKQDFRDLNSKFKEIRKLKSNRTKFAEEEKNIINRLKEFYNNYAEYLTELGFNEQQQKNVEKIIEIDMSLYYKKQYNNEDKYGNIMKKYTTEIINADILSGKEKDSIYFMTGMVINKSNKLVETGNYKFIEKRKKGDYFKPISWYYDSENKSIKRDANLSEFFTYIQNNGTILQEIVDEIIPIDDTNILQRFILGTLMQRFIQDVKKKNGIIRGDLLKILYKDLMEKANIEKYFGKEAFKKVFMQIIEANKTLLDSFSFDFNNECELSKNKLKFTSSGLELDLKEEEFNDILNIKIFEDKIIEEPIIIEKPIINGSELAQISEKAEITVIVYNKDNKKIIVRSEEDNKAKIFSFSFTDSLTDEQEKEVKDVKTGAELRKWILSHRKSLGIDIKIDEKLITTEDKLLEIDGAKKIEGIEYYKENGENKVIAYYKDENDKIKGFVFPVSEELTGNEPNEISYMLEKKFNKLKDWILCREYADKITTAEHLMKLNNEANISGFNHDSNNKKFYFKYKEGNKEKRGRLKLNKEINNISDTLSNKNLKNIVELKKWILNNRKKLGIDIEIEENPITTAEELSALDNYKKIEGIEYYQEKGENKIIAYYKDKKDKIKGVVLPFSKAGLSEEQQKEIKWTTLVELKKWILNNRKKLGRNRILSGER